MMDSKQDMIVVNSIVPLVANKIRYNDNLHFCYKHNIVIYIISAGAYKSCIPYICCAKVLKKNNVFTYLKVFFLSFFLLHSLYICMLLFYLNATKRVIWENEIQYIYLKTFAYNSSHSLKCHICFVIRCIKFWGIIWKILSVSSVSRISVWTIYP